MIKAVVFDLGNVILPFDVMRLASRLTVFSPLSADDLINKLWNNEIAGTFETGALSPEEYFARVTRSCQFTNLPIEKFIPVFNDIFVEDPEVIDLMRKLQSGHKLGLISNTNPIHAAHIREAYPNMALFDQIIFSNEVGIRKPDPGIYMKMLEALKVRAGEVVFIDDTEINVTGARNLGIRGIHYKNIKQLRQELKKSDVLIREEVQ